MALTDAGRRMLQLGETADMFEDLKRRDPSAAQGNVPWDGQSPRDLTKVAISLILDHEGASLMREDARLEEQCRRHQHGW